MNNMMEIKTAEDLREACPLLIDFFRWDESGITTFKRAKILFAVVTFPGMTTMEIADLTPEKDEPTADYRRRRALAILVALRKLDWVYCEDGSREGRPISVWKPYRKAVELVGGKEVA